MEPNYSKAHDMVSQVLKDNYVISYPINIRDIIRNYGLDILELDYKSDPKTKDVAGVINPEKKRIYVEESDTESRKAFTIAHELGHWLLHQKQLNEDNRYTVLYRLAIGWYNHEPIEAEANYFAACLLVPEAMLKEEYQKIQDPKELARIFNVSDEMMGYRLKEVGGLNNEENYGGF